MGIGDIFFVVSMETGCAWADIVEATKGTAYDAKCIIAMMVHEDANNDKKQLARLLKVDRSTVYIYIHRTNDILSTWPGMPRYNRVFKMLYLACNKRRVYLEERPEITLIHKDHV